MAAKSSIGLSSSPLDSLLSPRPAPAPRPVPTPAASEAPEIEAAPAEVPTLRAVPTPTQAPARKDRRRATFQMDAELIERARDTVVALSGPPVRLTLVDFVEAAVRREIARLEELHNEGEPFSPRSGEIRMGRPIS